MTAFPFATASEGWKTWATECETLSSALNVEALFPGQSGTGKLNDIISSVTKIGASGKELATSAQALSTTCGTQDGYDQALAQAPTVEDIKNLNAAVTKARQEYRNGTGTESALDSATTELEQSQGKRDTAVELHRSQTSGTAFQDPPTSGIAPLSAPGTSPGDTPSSPGGSDDDTSPSDEEPGDEDERSGDDEDDQGQQQNTGSQQPQQAAAQQQQPQQQGQQPQMSAQQQPGTQQPNMSSPDRDLSGLGPDDYSPGDYSDIDPGPGTELSADRGGISHGTTLSDTSGRGPSPYGAPTGTAPGANQQSNYMGRGGMGGGMMGGMGGMGGQRGGESRRNDRPEVLSSDPEGRKGDEYAFEGGLVSKENPEEAAFLEWISAEDRETIERRENPHVNGQR